MEHQAFYQKLAHYYDLVYHWKNYAEETDRIKELISKHKLATGNKLLEVACGTGKHLEYLQGDYSCAGLDIHQEMLDIASTRLPEVPLQQGNMIDFQLMETFDIITCLFSSIGYVKTYENLQRTIANFYSHLNSGGVILLEPWLPREIFKTGSPHLHTYESENIKVARLCVSQVKEDISIMDMHYCVAERDKEVSHFVDRHEMGLFSVEKTLEFMNNCGFQTQFLEKGISGRGLYIGVKS